MTRRLLPALLLLAACAPVHKRQVTYGEVAPLPLVHPSNDKDRWYLHAELGELGDHLFFFDTGYATTTCDDDFVKKLGLEPRGRVRVQGEAGSVDARRVKLPPFTLGGHQLNNVWCLVRDLNTTSSIRDPREVDIAGVLGADVLSPFVTLVDPTVPEVRLHHPKERPPLSKDTAVRMRRESPFSSRRTLPVLVGTRTIHPVIDTGASGTYLDGESLGLPVTERREGVLVRGSGLKGEVRMDLTYYRADLSVGAQTTPAVRITSRGGSPLDDGLLGLNVLGGYLAEYDFRRGLAQLTPVEPADVPSWFQYQQRRSTPTLEDNTLSAP